MNLIPNKVFYSPSVMALATIVREIQCKHMVAGIGLLDLIVDWDILFWLYHDGVKPDGSHWLTLHGVRILGVAP